RRSPRRALRRPARARAGAEAGRHLRLGADDRGDRPRPAARPGVLAQPPLAHDVQPARPLRRRDDPRAGARRVLADQPGRAHVDLQAPRGRALPRRPGADLRRRQVHLRPALREVPGKSDFIAVDRVEPTGRYGVKFLTKEPFAGLLAALGGFWGFILSEAGIKKHGDLNTAALGTGPFMLQDWKVEQQMVLKRHPHYFKKGLPHVDEVILRIIPDEANIVAA